MGRTNRTYRNHLDNLIDSFKPFRKGLREERKHYLDSLWEKAHRYASAAAYMNPKDPALPALISIMVGLEEKLEKNAQRLENLENRISELENGIQD